MRKLLFITALALTGCVSFNASLEESIANDLGVQSEYTVTKRVPVNCRSLGAAILYVGCAVMDSNGNAIVEVNPFLGRDYGVHVLAHELAHVRQMELGMCFSYSEESFFDNPHEGLAESYAKCLVNKGVGNGCGDAHYQSIKPYLNCKRFD